MIIRDPNVLSAQPACVLLDLDDTLYAYAPCHEAGLAEAAALARDLVELSPADFTRLYADGRQQVKARLGKTASAHSRLLYFQRMLELAGLASQVGAALQLEQVYWRAFLDTSRLHDGAAEFLDDLRIARVPVVIVTDLTAQIQFRKMLYWRLDRLADWIVTSEESGADKPDPASYRLALEKVGWKSGPVWMISDEIKDIVGAKARLPEAVGLLKANAAPTQRPPPEADIVFDSFETLRRRLVKTSN